MLEQTVGEQSARNVQDRRADLEELRIGPEALERGATTAYNNPVTATGIEGSVAAFVGDLGEAGRRRDFDAVPVSCVFDGNIPDVVFVIAGGHAEAGPSRRVVANAVIGIASAVGSHAAAAADTLHDIAPGEIAR